MAFEVRKGEGDGVWKGVLPDRWMVGRVPSGGVVTSILLRATSREVSTLSPLSASITFLRKTEPSEEYQCRVSVVKKGKRFWVLETKMFQHGKERCRMISMFGDLGSALRNGPNRLFDAFPPKIKSNFVRLDGGDNSENSVRSRVMIYVDPKCSETFVNCRKTQSNGEFNESTLLDREARTARHGTTSYEGFMYFKDDVPVIDACTYPVLLDAALPPVLGKHVAGWVPTLTWSIQFKSVLTNSNRVSFRFRTTHIAGGYLEEDGELWDMSTGKLLAISRQLAMVGVSQRRRSNTTSAL